jgi:hypothetical protein
VADLDDSYDQDFVRHFVDDSIDTLANPVSFLARELLAAGRPRVVAQGFYAPKDSGKVFFRYGPKILGDGLLEDEFITCNEYYWKTT